MEDSGIINHMKTIIRTIDQNNIEKAAIQEAGRILQEGGLVAFPTETVYGLGADALNEEAAIKTYEAKGRPSDNPLIVHIAEFSALPKIVEEIPPLAEALAEHFWPGPLTMIFKKRAVVPYGTTGGLDTVAVRMPENLIARELILAAGGYISAPSANVSGRPSPTTAEHVYTDLNGRISMILDGGSVEIGLESTILDMTVTPPMILRPGAITREMLATVLPYVAVDPSIHGEDRDTAPKAPGMKYRHYAPKAELIIVDGPAKLAVKAIRQMAYEHVSKGEVPGIIGTTETVGRYTHGIIKSIGTRNSEKSIARNLYAILRAFDEEGVSVIYSESFAAEGMGDAIMNRLEKAAGHHRVSAEEIVRMQKYHQIMFLSESDTSRGPMAAEILRNQTLNREYDIISRGLIVLFPEPVNQKAEAIMASHKLSMASYQSKMFDPDEIEADTLVLAMNMSQKQKVMSECGIEENIYTLSEFVQEEEQIGHPIGQPLSEYGKCFETIERLIKKLTQKLNEL